MEERKSKEERSEGRRTLFVRNLPYSTTDDQLTSVFAEYGAVKTCFTVKNKGITDKCKGYGYVLFEKREDAERARGGVKKVKGRLVQIVFADKRPVREKRREEGGREEKEKTKIIPETELIDDVESESESEDSERDSDYDDDLMSDDEKNSSSHATGQRKPKSQRREARYDAGRVVVVTGVPPGLPKGKLRRKFSKYGPLEEFVYPVATTEHSGEGDNGAKAQVTYVNYADARKAVVGLQGSKFSSSGNNSFAAVLMSKEGKTVSKATLVKSRLIVRNIGFSVTSKDIGKVFGRYGNIKEIHIPRKPNGYMRGFAFVQFTSYFDAKRALEGVNGVEIRGRPVAVDWVVPKTTYEASLNEKEEGGEEGGEEEEEGGEEEEEEGGEEEEKEGGEEEEKEEDEEDKDEGEQKKEEQVMDTENEEMEEEEEENDEEREPVKKPFRPDVHEGTTVFVRNLPLDSSEEELKELFSQFGRVRYARIVLDKTTGLSRGSAFVQFLKPASVQQCVESFDSNEKVLLYNGRELDVSLALSPEELTRMRERGTEKTDKRNLYLAKEGNIQTGSEAAEDLTKAELTKRLKAQAEKKAKLANPNFYVSKTRLSVRNLPTKTTESELKEIFNAAIDSGKIVQLKILRSKDRVDASGLGRSKGFAFVEFSTHETALTALRATNNNPSLFPSRKRLIVEFAVEDVRVMKVREERKKRQRERTAGGQAGGQNSGTGGQARGQNSGAGGQEGEEQKKSKKVDWQLRCKEKRLRRRDRKNQGNGGALLSQGKEAVSEDGELEGGRVGPSKGGQEKGATKGFGKESGLQRRENIAVKHVNGQTKRLARVVGEIGAVGRKRSRDTAELVDKTDAVAEKRVKLSRKQSRNAKKRGREMREEEKFVEMVDSYRRKLTTL